MAWVDPNEAFDGKILLLAPHMDDEVLACGGTIARLQHKESLHLAYATDGSMSPVPSFPWQGARCPDLPQIRRKEALSALAILGVSQANIHFLDLPDRQLTRQRDRLRSEVRRLLQELAPDIVFIPFRYDRHPDHIALHHAVAGLLHGAGQQVRLVEYFVYYRWQLLPGNDLRVYLRPNHLLQVDITACAARKKQALNCFQSQTTHFFAWQERPILPSQRVEEVSKAPELFLEHIPTYSGTRVFASAGLWIRTVHTIEPPLKKLKDQALALLHVARANGRNTPN